MSDEAVSFHFSESKTTTSCATFSWLACEHLHLTSGSGVDFVSNHVVKFLVVDYADEYVCNEFFACCAVVEDFASCVAEAEFY